MKLTPDQEIIQVMYILIASWGNWLLILELIDLREIFRTRAKSKECVE